MSLTYKSKDVNHLLEPNNVVLQGPCSHRELVILKIQKGATR